MQTRIGRLTENPIEPTTAWMTSAAARRHPASPSVPLRVEKAPSVGGRIDWSASHRSEHSASASNTASAGCLVTSERVCVSVCVDVGDSADASLLLLLLLLRDAIAVSL